MEKNIFSIYKMDWDKLKRKLKVQNEEPSVNDYYEALMKRLSDNAKEKSGEYFNEIEGSEFKGVVYRTMVPPRWKKLIENMSTSIEIEGNKKNISWLVNTNVSYILLHMCNGQIYAVTGGYGHYLIRDYVEYNWGLYLITKFVRKDDAIIRELKENYLFGNTSMINKANRNNTNFVVEKEISAIYSEIFIELDNDGIAKLGISPDAKNKKKKTGVQFKDSIYIRKSISLPELKIMIQQINELESQVDNFSLSYFVPVKKCEMTSAPLKHQLIENLINRQYDTIQLIGDDYINYCVTSDEYTLIDDNENEFYNSEDMITIESVFDILESKEIKITKNFLERFLMSWKICTKIKDGGYCISPIRIYDAIQGFVEEQSSKMPYYIFQGQWYSMDKKYEEYLEEEFVDLFKKWDNESKELKVKFGLLKGDKNEEAYNESFYEEPNMIVAHTALVSNYEIADIFFWDEENLYIMCNKDRFNAGGSRDLMNQIRASSIYFQTQLRAENRVEFVEKLYGSIKKKYDTKGKKLHTSQEEFLNVLSKKKFFYVAGYLKGYRENSNSPYAKCLTIDFNKEMTEKGMHCLVMGLDE